MRVLPALVLAVAAACGTDAYGLPDRPPDIEGLVTSVTTSSSGVTTVLIEEVSTYDGDAPRQGRDKASVRITSSTRVVDGVYQPLDPIRIRAGERARARAWFTGPVAESYPVQAEAEVLVFWILAP